ncbi:hypothetical protein [Nonomuraea recticatena]
MNVASVGRRPPSRRGREARRNLTAYGFLVAALICFGLFSWYPMVRKSS